MADTKTFPTLQVAACACGYILADGQTYSDMADVAAHALGHQVWTHELGDKATMDRVRMAIHGQFPNLPTREEAQADWRAAADKAISAYGETVDLQRGNEERTETPMGSLMRMTGGAA